MLLRSMTESRFKGMPQKQKRATAPLSQEAQDADAPIEEPNSSSDDNDHNDGQEARSSRTTTDGERILRPEENDESGNFLAVETEHSDDWAKSADQCSNTEEYF